MPSLLITLGINVIRRSGNLRHYEPLRYAGHSKWQNIKNTKQANDLAKGKLISRYVQLVRRAIVTNNMQTNPKLNSKLGGVLAEASKLNVPKATLERAIARAANIQIKSINLEAQGPRGSSFIIKCETDNPSNLRREVKRILKKLDAALLPDDTVVNMFKSIGIIRAYGKTSDGQDIGQEEAEEAAIIAEAEEVDVEIHEDASDVNLSKILVFTTDPENINRCRGELEKQNIRVISCETELVPYRYIDFGDNKVIEQTEEIQRALKDFDQVVEVYHNVDMSAIK